MNGRERMLAAVRREPSEEIAVFHLAMTFAARLAGVCYRDYCRYGERRQTLADKMCIKGNLRPLTLLRCRFFRRC